MIKIEISVKLSKICLTRNTILLKGAVSAFWGVPQISKSFIWIDLLLEKDYSDMHKNAKNAILADLKRFTFLLT